mgnify:CR=1 FL=1
MNQPKSQNQIRNATACGLKSERMDKHRQISAKGGSAGKGDAKRRDREHYVEMNRKRWEAHKARKAAESETQSKQPS